MNKFFNAMTTNDSFTANGAVTHSTSSSSCLDLFFLIGASRGKNLDHLFLKAFSESPEVAIRIMLWSRDIRQGIGERDHIKRILTILENNKEYDLCKRIMNKLPELGRWDDMLGVQTHILRQHAAKLIAGALREGNGLCAKWMPREGSAKSEQAKWLREHLRLTPKQYRKLLAKLTKVVETNLCNKDYTFEYKSVPSQAMLKYLKAFYRNDSERFLAYKQSLVKGETKVNAGAVYPHELINKCIQDDTIATQMWNSLPEFFPSEDISILPVCDVSASMYGTPMEMSVGLGLYIAQRANGPFKNIVMTFCGSPSIYQVSPQFTSLWHEWNQLKRSAPDMSTNIQAVFQKFLLTLVTHQCTVEDMPKTLLIISDMEFNNCGNIPNFDAIKDMYEQAGYPMPQLVFWNVNGREGNVPVKMSTEGVALVSGSSPSVLKAIFTKDLNPMNIMYKTIGVERYDY